MHIAVESDRSKFVDLDVPPWGVVGARRRDRADAGDRPVPAPRGPRTHHSRGAHRVDRVGRLRPGVLGRGRGRRSARRRSVSTSAAT